MKYFQTFFGINDAVFYTWHFTFEFVVVQLQFGKSFGACKNLLSSANILKDSGGGKNLFSFVVTTFISFVVATNQQHSSTRLESWNVGSLCERGVEVCEELRKRKVDVCGLQEVRWKNEGT